ncbi:CRISPR-associated primase-polymerase type B [Ornithobacterium rhinotracheale]|uniref:CRISPR-associated primase-polymerase type B n=1 Tax=Ornithobacterium rhinotracheale TaxID=28251 RepID=UPI001FF58313|nr:CRISPR-associated primase-polymerase type B [Ornithobacterium rhinotracheale]MCK0205598.1 CRISPR-associated primase-polymerase type B [Ornithobacterium rhinotracheale]
MIYAGKQVTNNTEPLKKISISYFVNSLRNPKPQLELKIRQLRKIHSIDKKSYAALKKELPYIVCAAFNPPYRKIENFAYTEYFIVDIDHISQKDNEVHALKEKIQKDERVLLAFISPSQDGIKVLFKLKERCYDAGLYSMFYKKFIIDFSNKYDLSQVVDAKTSDVSRACFVSVDPTAYYNSEAEPIDIQQYLNLASPFDIFSQQYFVDKAIAKEAKKEKEKQKTKDAEDSGEPDAEAILKIKEILKQSKPIQQATKAPAYVPEQLNQLMGDLIPYIKDTGIDVLEIVNIHYGKKLKLKLGLKFSEINLFYGKKGFSVVASPKTGTHPELNELVRQLIINYLDGNDGGRS